MTKEVKDIRFGKKMQRRVAVTRQVILAFEECADQSVSLKRLVDLTLQYGAGLTPAVKPGEAESAVVLTWMAMAGEA